MKGGMGVLAAIALFALGIFACGGGGGGTATSTGSGGGTAITLSGTLDGTTLAKAGAAFKPSGSSGALSAPATVTNIVAFGNDGSHVEATMSGNAMSLQLVKGVYYVVAALNGTSLVGLFKADSGSDLDSFPVQSSGTDLNLGAISLDATIGKVLAAATQASVFGGMGLDGTTASALGGMDNEMLRRSNVDVDGNGVADYSESKTFDLTISYEFLGGAFSSLIGAFADTAGYSQKGYMYWFNSSLTGQSYADATLHSPQGLNGGNDMLQCYLDTSNPSLANANFYCGGSATTPVKPPTGTYTVTAGGATYTFNNVDSIALDGNMNNVYVPVIRLTQSAGQLTLVEWQWWKKTNGAWAQVSDTEIKAVVAAADFSIGSAGWVAKTAGTNLNGIAASGSAVPPAQSFTPAAFRFEYKDKQGFNYGFEWQ